MKGALVAGLAAVVVAVAAGSGRSATPDATLLAEVRYTGGLCMPRACDTRMRLLADGRLLRNGTLVHRVQAPQLRALRRAIAAIDIAEIRRHPFTGVCPTAYDGQEATYRFRGIRMSLSSCRWDLTHVAAVRSLERLVSARR
jgi:hypothetical protein